MKKTTTLLSVLMVCTAFISVNAVAEDNIGKSFDASYPVLPHGESVKSSAEVKNEWVQERKANTVQFSNATYPVLQQGGKAKTRAEVVAELEQAKKDGSLAANARMYGSR